MVTNHSTPRAGISITTDSNAGNTGFTTVLRKSKQSFLLSRHIFGVCFITDGNTATLSRIVVDDSTIADSNVTTICTGSTAITNRSLPDSNTVIRACAGFTDSNRLRAFSTIIIIVSTISRRVYMEVMNLIGIQLRYVYRISICRTGCYISNRLASCINARCGNRRTISDCKTGCTESYCVTYFDTVQIGKVFGQTNIEFAIFGNHSDILSRQVPLSTADNIQRFIQLLVDGIS